MLKKSPRFVLSYYNPGFCYCYWPNCCLKSVQSILKRQLKSSILTRLHLILKTSIILIKTCCRGAAFHDGTVVPTSPICPEIVFILAHPYLLLITGLTVHSGAALPPDLPCLLWGKPGLIGRDWISSRFGGRYHI